MVAATKFFAQNIIARAISARPLNTRDTPDNSGVYHPRDIFTPSVKGAVWSYDDFSYLYQKADGSIPITALEQPVGFRMDERYGGARGDDVKSTGAARLIGTATAATFNTSTGVGTAVRVDGSNFSGVRFSSLTGSSFYALTVNNTGSASLTIRTGDINGAGIVTLTAGSSGTYFVLSNATGEISISPTNNSTTIGFTVSSVRELPGLHAYQSTDAARPVISARYNLLLNTVFAGAVAGTPGTAPTSWAYGSSGGTLAVDTSATDAVLTFSATTARHFIGQAITAAANTSYTFTATVTANIGITFANILNVAQALAGATVSRTLNGAVATGNETPAAGDTLKVVLSVAATGGSATFRLGAGCDVNSTGSVSLSKPDLRLTADANSRLPAYQRVTTATDYDSAGFPRFLRIDATDDFLQTASVDPGTDKVFVCAGVTKVSDAAAALLVESSTNSTTTAGAFALRAPVSGASSAYTFYSSGTGFAAKDSAANAAPHTAVLCGIGDISGDSCRVRVNGVEPAAATTDQGTGNYTAQPIYIGARAGTSSRLNNGRIYPMVICFKAVTAGEIAATEAWVNARTKAFTP